MQGFISSCVAQRGNHSYFSFSQNLDRDQIQSLDNELPGHMLGYEGVFSKYVELQAFLPPFALLLQ